MTRALKGPMTMTANIDVKKYLGSRFIKLADVEDGPMTLRIAEVVEGKYDKLNLIFASGQQFSLNKTNTGRLANDLGMDVRKWVDADVKLFAGNVDTQDGKQPGVELEVLMSEAKPAAKPTATKPKLGDMDDEIPF
jgi:hypothetical protein